MTRARLVVSLAITVTSVRRSVLLATLALATAWTLTAQAQGYDDEHVQRRDDDVSHFRERLGEALRLTEDQKDSLRALRSDLKQHLESLRDQVEYGSLTPEDARVQYRWAMRSQRASRDEILTEDQRGLLERARRFEEEEKLAGPRQQQRPRARLAEALELADWQKEQWRELLQEQRRSVQEMREEGEVLSREEIRRLRAEHRSAFMAILTPEQAVRFEEIRENWQRRQEEDEGDAAGFGIEVQEELGTAVEENWEMIESR